MIALYSYLLKEKTIRDPTKKYLIIATVTDSKSSSNENKGFFGNGSGDAKNNAKMIKAFDRKFASL